MINERPCLPGRRKQDGPADCGAQIPKVLPRPLNQETMMSGMAAFMAAVGGTSLICYLLMNRVQNRKTGAIAQVATLPAQVRAAVRAVMAGICFPGSAATVLRRIVPPRPAIPAGTAEGAVATAAVAAIDAENSPVNQCQCDLAQSGLFKFIPVFPRHQFGIA